MLFTEQLSVWGRPVLRIWVTVVIQPAGIHSLLNFFLFFSLWTHFLCFSLGKKCLILTRKHVFHSIPPSYYISQQTALSRQLASCFLWAISANASIAQPWTVKISVLLPYSHEAWGELLNSLPLSVRIYENKILILLTSQGCYEDSMI